MAHTLFLRIVNLGQAPGDVLRAEWQAHDGKECLAASNGALADIVSSLPAALGSEYETIVLLPGHSVLVSEVTLSRQHEKHLQSAAAYALEDRLAESPEEVHIATSAVVDSEAGLTCRVGIIRKLWLSQLVEALDAAGVTPSLITSDSALLPYETGQGSLLIDGEQLLFQLTPAAASSLEQDTFLSFLENYLVQAKATLAGPAADAAVTPQRLKLWLPRQLSGKQPAFLEKLQALCSAHTIALAKEPYDGSAFDWLCARWLDTSPAQSPPDFLHGFHPQTGGVSSYWKKLVGLVAAWFALQMAFDMGASIYLQHKADRLYAESTALYQQLFPGDRVVDIKTQAAQHFSAGDKGVGLFSLLQVLAASPDRLSRIDIETIVYDADRRELAVDVTAQDASTVVSWEMPPGFTLEAKPAGNGAHMVIRGTR